ncbi:MAG: copper resistance protein CopC [Microbacterium sp.]
MKTTARSIPIGSIALALAATLLTAFLTLFAPLPASAHDALLSSSPEADATVETLPAELTLTFSGKLIDAAGATEVVVTDAAGTSVSNGPAVLSGGVVTQPLVAAGDAGVYHVVWKIVSSDGHPASGEFSFTVATSTVPAETAEPTPSTQATPDAVRTPTSEPGGSSGDSTGFWMLGVVGVLVVAAVILVLSRRGNRSETGSGDSAAR